LVFLRLDASTGKFAHRKEAGATDLVARVALARPVELFRLSDVAATFDHGSPDKNAVKEKAFRAIL